jgi:hypothetical protein
MVTSTLLCVHTSRASLLAVSQAARPPLALLPSRHPRQRRYVTHATFVVHRGPLPLRRPLYSLAWQAVPSLRSAALLPTAIRRPLPRVPSSLPSCPPSNVQQVAPPLPPRAPSTAAAPSASAAPPAPLPPKPAASASTSGGPTATAATPSLGSKLLTSAVRIPTPGATHATTTAAAAAYGACRGALCCHHRCAPPPPAGPGRGRPEARAWGG